MIEKWDKKSEEFFNLDTAPFALTLKPGDIIVMKIDQEKWDLNTISEYIKIMSQTFPSNPIMTTYDGLEVQGVFRNGRQDKYEDIKLLH